MQPVLRGASPWFNPPPSQLNLETKHEELLENIYGQAPWWLVHPRTSRWLRPWDSFIGLCLIFTAFVTPFEVGFMESSFDELFVTNRAPPATLHGRLHMHALPRRCELIELERAHLSRVTGVIDVIFILDMLLQFCLIVPQAEGAIGLGRAGYVTSPKVIARRYLSSWFAIDLISVLVSGVDIAVVSTGDVDGDFSKLRALRVLRALRLVKLARLARASRIFKRWETYFSVNYALVSLVSAGLSICFFAHLMACVWALQAKLVTDPMTTWLVEYCETSSVRGRKGGGDITLEMDCPD